jgi:hypothetical protein
LNEPLHKARIASDAFGFTQRESSGLCANGQITDKAALMLTPLRDVECESHDKTNRKPHFLIS